MGAQDRRARGSHSDDRLFPDAARERADGRAHPSGELRAGDDVLNSRLRPGYHTPVMSRSTLSLFVGLVLALTGSACRRSWDPNKFKGTNEELFSRTVREYQRKKWDTAIQGLEKLTVQLPARDTLLPRSH